MENEYTVIELQKRFIEDYYKSGTSLTHLAAKIAYKKGRLSEFANMVFDQMEDHKFPPFTEKQNAEFLKLFKKEG